MGVNLSGDQVLELIEKYYDTASSLEADSELPSIHPEPTVAESPTEPLLKSSKQASSPKKSAHPPSKRKFEQTNEDLPPLHQPSSRKRPGRKSAISPVASDAGLEFTEFFLPNDEFEALIEDARKSGVESVVSEEEASLRIHEKTSSRKKQSPSARGVKVSVNDYSHESSPPPQTASSTGTRKSTRSTRN